MNKCDLGSREYGRGDPLHWPRDSLYPQKLALTSPTSGSRTVGIVRLRIKATEFSLIFYYEQVRTGSILSWVKNRQFFLTSKLLSDFEYY
jgi:hypothetical protein